MSQPKHAQDSGPVDYVVRTLMGLEPLVASEAEACGAVDIQPGRRSVSFSIKEEGLYRFLQTTRFGVRVLRPVFRFQAKGPDDLHAKAVKLNWSQWVDVRKSMALDLSLIHI